MNPSIGRIVHYTNLGDAAGKYPPEQQAAIITRVRAAGAVSLLIFYPTGQFFMDNVPYSETYARGCWSWPLLLDVPVPPPPPVPTITSLLQPDESKFMKLVVDEWVSQPGWEKDVAFLRFVRTIHYGDTVDVSFERRLGYPIDKFRNIKVFRVWKDMGYPNFYLGMQKDMSWVFYVEKLEPLNGITRSYCHFSASPGAWQKERWLWKNPSGVGQKDGALSIFVGDGATPILQINTLQLDSTAMPGLPNNICIQDDYSPNSGDAGPLPAESSTAYRRISIKINGKST